MNPVPGSLQEPGRRPRVRRRLQPRAVARGDLARGRPADEGGRRQLRHPRRLLLGEARTPAGRAGVRLAGPADGPDARERHRRRPRHPHLLAPALDGPAAPRHPARRPRTAAPSGGAAASTSRTPAPPTAATPPPSPRTWPPATAATPPSRCGTSTTSTAPSTGATRRRRLPPLAAGRYGTLDALNEAWGTAFWSQGYDDWDEILPPAPPHYMTNPTQVLDFKRFTSDMLLECYVAERDIVRRPPRTSRSPPTSCPSAGTRPGAGPRRRTSSPSTSTPTRGPVGARRRPPET